MWRACVCAVVAVAVLACRKADTGADPVAGSAAGSGSAVASADAGGGFVDLLREAPATLRVSSQVANPKIRPDHLVDKSLETAWNSRTGELAGAWIEVTTAGTIEELRLTAGHTGHGAGGEDYFTMNPRIQKITVLKGDTVLVTAPLDITRRDLQTVKVHADGMLRIRIDEVVPGSKPRWREACISELEVWGTLPAGARKPGKPTVVVAPPPVDLDKLCAGIESEKAGYHAAEAAVMKRCAEMAREANNPDLMNQCGIDEPGEPDCSVDPITIANLGGPWRRAVLLYENGQSNYELHSETVMIESAAGTIVGPRRSWDSRSAHLEILAAAVQPNDQTLLELRFRDENQPDTEAMVVCRTVPRTGCSNEIPKGATGSAATPVFP
jgi:hypothetical protein